MRLVTLQDEPPEVWLWRFGVDLSMFHWTFGQVTLRLHPHPDGWLRGRGYWPRRGIRPLYRLYHFGPVSVMRWVGSR